MKKVLTIILISIIYPGILSKGILQGINTKAVSFTDEILCLDTDTGSVNPFLNIRKVELDILPPSSGVQVYGNGVLYLSLSRRDTRMVTEHVSFGDLELVFAPFKDSVPGEPEILSISRQIAIPAEGITISDDHSGFYYSKISERDGKVKIYSAGYKIEDSQDFWEIGDKTASFCTDNYNYTHPAISSEGNIMIFSSDMPGSNGELDLYISRYENNAWSEPENMGNRFNSTGSELYAYLDVNNNLYYSSNGLPGLGGFDIFFSSFDGHGWDDPVNLYNQINTPDDEVAFRTNRDNSNMGFYTRINRTGVLKKKMKRELYKVELSDKYNNKAYLLADVLNNYALESPLLVMFKDEKKPEEESLNEAQRIADSLRAAEMKAARLAEEQRKAEEQIVADSISTANARADSLAAEQQEAERLAKEQRVADSLKAEQLRADLVAKEERRQAELQREEQLKREQQRTEEIVYKIQFLSSMKPLNPRTIILGGTSYQTSGYFYKGAWRITLGEFTNLDDAVRVRKLLNKEGYSEAFVAVFVNGERSLDMKYFR
jgi:hypothetical protein